MIFIQLFGLALLTHEALMLCAEGKRYLTWCILPTFGLTLSPRQMCTAHVALMVLSTALVVWPQVWPLYPALLIVLTIVMASYKLRLSNHLVVAWTMGVILCLDLLLFQHPASISTEPTAFLFTGVQMVVILTYLLSFFHKLNREFISLADSCGAMLARLYLEERRICNPRVVKAYALCAVYGTLLLEAVIPALLLVPSTHPLGILLAVVLHIPFGLLCHVHFSSVMYAGLSAFVEPEAWPGLTEAALALGWPGALVCGVAGALVGWRLGLTSALRHRRAGRVLQIYFGIYSMGAMAVSLMLLAGGALPADRWQGLGAREWMLLAVVGAVYLLNGLGPYLGVKTEFSLAMFSNLRPEPWCHLLFPAAWRPFNLARYVRVETITGLPEYGGHQGGWAVDVVLVYLRESHRLQYTSYFFHEGLQMVCRSTTPMPVVRVAYVEAGERHEVADYGREMAVCRPRYRRLSLFPVTLPIDPAEPHCS